MLCATPSSKLWPKDQAAAFTMGFWDRRQVTAVTYMAPTDTQQKVGGKWKLHKGETLLISKAGNML